MEAGNCLYVHIVLTARRVVTIATSSLLAEPNLVKRAQCSKLKLKATSNRRSVISFLISFFIVLNRLTVV